MYGCWVGVILGKSTAESTTTAYWGAEHSPAGKTTNQKNRFKKTEQAVAFFIMCHFILHEAIN